MKDIRKWFYFKVYMCGEEFGLEHHFTTPERFRNVFESIVSHYISIYGTDAADISVEVYDDTDEANFLGTINPVYVDSDSFKVKDRAEEVLVFVRKRSDELFSHYKEIKNDNDFSEAYKNEKMFEFCGVYELLMDLEKKFGKGASI